MNNREEFEKWLKNKFCYSERRWKELLKYDESYYTFWISISYDAWQEATNQQQKIIDELKAREESRQRACDDCMMRFSSTISQLEADSERLKQQIKSFQDSAQKLLDILGGVA